MIGLFCCIYQGLMYERKFTECSTIEPSSVGFLNALMIFFTSRLELAISSKKSSFSQQVVDLCPASTDLVESNISYEN